ncbi:UTP--glucose-1-phosphate uridylyltransferase [Flavobacteriaceae bacterium TP-CH-4]|uniref:UTP--glucose-1-phosphate uridylyltransferase n=1 Tax=Pelagihabitans pacificus TaxID=2696054 RepID=A0A967E9I0_9FLAO|nr:sugar phosphate nucleotidyltransferase [Pelagihabitans pacificus]NHF58486.1 UTP--glucose-1-phosphate uridylyltransferase [Pelagihabitans pacificus]
MTLLLMAAGSGSRYGKLKQFDDLGPKGEFLMEFAMYDAIKNGFGHIVVITKKENVDFLREHLEARLPKTVKLDVLSQEISDLPDGMEFSGERLKPWGTAHAVWTARDVIKDPFCVINADDFYGQSAYENAAKFIREHPQEDHYALVGYILKDTLSEHGSVSRGVCMTSGDDLVSVDERLKLEQKGDKVVDADSGLEYTGNELASMNFWICRPSIFGVIETEFREFLQDDQLVKTGELYIPKTVQKMLKDGLAKVKVVPAQDQWFGVTYASDRETAVASLKQKTAEGQYITPLWSM